MMWKYKEWHITTSVCMATATQYTITSMERIVVFIRTSCMKKLFIWVAQFSTLANTNNPGKGTECF